MRRFLDLVMLKHPDFTKPLYINTYASGIAVGAVLYQLNEDNSQQVIAFASQSLL